MTVSTKNLRLLIAEFRGKKDIDYRIRTRIEREFFLWLKDYCSSELTYDLQGLASEHKYKLDVFCARNNVKENVKVIIDNLFELCYLLWGLTSLNPYAEWGTVVKLGANKVIEIKAEDRFKLAKELESKYGELFPVSKNYYATKFGAICAFCDQVEAFMNKVDGA